MASQGYVSTCLPHLSPVPKPHVKCSESMSLFSLTLTSFKSSSCMSVVLIWLHCVALKYLGAGVEVEGEDGFDNSVPLFLGRAHLEPVV